MSLPSVSEVRQRIESVQREDIRLYLQALYIVGASRSYELTGKICPRDSGHRPIIYGPRGTDATLTTYQPTEISSIQLAQIMSKQLTLKKALQPVKVALFRIKIAKQKLEPEEEPPSRLVALPMDKQYEPWTEPLYNYFKQAGKDYVFPFTRQDAWNWITKKEPIFKGLVYPIKKYTWHKKTGLTETVLRHTRPLKLHGLRHVRTDELRKTYKFDGFDYAAYVGWSLATARKETAMPGQIETYAELRENWQSYFPKLLQPRVF